jgi:hypothetical protein
VTSKSLNEGSLRNSSWAQAQLAIRVSCEGVSLATSESSGGGRPARFSGATRFGRAFGACTGTTHVALCVRQQAIEQYASRHFGQLYFAAGVAQTAQGRSGRGMGVAFVSAAARAGRSAALPCTVSVGGSAGEAMLRRALSQRCGHGAIIAKRQALGTYKHVDRAGSSCEQTF